MVVCIWMRLYFCNIQNKRFILELLTLNMNGFTVCASDSLLMALIEIWPCYAGRQRPLGAVLTAVVKGTLRLVPGCCWWSDEMAVEGGCWCARGQHKRTVTAHIHRDEVFIIPFLHQQDGHKHQEDEDQHGSADACYFHHLVGLFGRVWDHFRLLCGPWREKAHIFKLTLPKC